MKIQSMTGYGEAEEGGFKVEVKSVNHRFLDIHFRMPSVLNPHELELKKLVKERFARGRIDITISFTENTDIQLNINQQAARTLLDSLGQICQALKLESRPQLDHLFWFRDIVFKQTPEFRPEELFTTFQKALDALEEMRTKEGAFLLNSINQIVENIEGLVDRIRKISENSASGRYENIKQKVQALVENIEIDEQRLLQEIAFLADRVDISEEITRIKSHLNQMRSILSEGGPVGRKLDFLLQELNRETNTIGSKSIDYQVSELVINVKTEIEKIREQIQNLQ
ncbi:MAG: YicC family protein [Nitrospirae bacterium]|nr:YicC family protein [Nitrospirota bacterium]